MRSTDDKPPQLEQANNHGVSQGVLRILLGVARTILRSKLGPAGRSHNAGAGGWRGQWHQIRAGMSEARALEALGAPDETYPFGAAGRSLTLWVYDRGEEPVYLWVDEAGRVKMTCRASVDRGS